MGATFLKNKKTKTNYSVPAVHRSLDIIETLAGAERGLTITEVSRRFKIPKSSAFGLLQTLKARGYLEKDSEDRYSLTLRIFGLGSALIDSFDLRKQLYPLLKELTEKSHITGHIAVLDQGYAVYVEKIEVMGAIRLTTGIGKRMHLHCTAIGKALLAYQPEDEIDRVVAERGLPRQTAKTIINPQELKAELARVRNLGYAVSNEENEEGVRAVAAPIFDHTARVIAAVNLGGSTIQIKTKNFPLLGELVRSYAERMSRKLGYVRRIGVRP